MYKMTDAEMVTLRELADEAIAAVKKLQTALASFSRAADEPAPETTECVFTQALGDDPYPSQGRQRFRSDFYDHGLSRSPDCPDALACVEGQDQDPRRIRRHRGVVVGKDGKPAIQETVLQGRRVMSVREVPYV